MAIIYKGLMELLVCLPPPNLSRLPSGGALHLSFQFSPSKDLLFFSSCSTIMEHPPRKFRGVLSHEKCKLVLSR